MATCLDRTGRDEFQIFPTICDHDQDLIQGFNLATLILWAIFTIVVFVHFALNGFQLSVHTKNKYFGKAQNYSRALMFVLLFITGCIFTSMAATRYGLEQTCADQGGAVNYLLAAAMSAFWASGFTYRISLLALYLMLDNYQTRISVPLVSVGYFILWLSYTLGMFVVFGLHVNGTISGEQVQTAFYVLLILVGVLSAPGWSILPFFLIRGIKKRAFKSGGKLSDANAFLLKKLKSGMAIQAIAGIVVLIMCVLALSVPSIIQYNTVILHMMFVAGVFICALQFVIFGGLTKGRYAHKAYMREDNDKSPSGNKTSTNHSTKETHHSQGREETTSTKMQDRSQIMDVNITNSNKGDEVEGESEINKSVNNNNVDEERAVEKSTQQDS